MNGIRIPKQPQQKENYSFHRKFARSARIGLEHFFRSLWPKDRTILLPAYIGVSPFEGSGVFDPIRACEMKYQFYRLNDRLEVDLEHLQKQIVDSKPFGVFLIHYFGFPQPDTIEIKTLCQSRGILLIEDCAHAFDSKIGSSQIGTIGDIAIFSIHKILPCNDGGILQINNPALTVSPLDPQQVCDASRIEIFCNADWHAITEHKRKNYIELEKLVRSIRNISCLYPALTSGVSPMNLPVLIENRDRFEVYTQLRNQDIGAIALYHTLIPEIQEQEYPGSHHISRRILNLPIHQDISPDQLEYIASALSRVVA